MVRKIVHLRWKQRLGPVEIGDRLGMPSSTVHAVLVRCRLNRLTHLDRATGEPIRRYQHDHPGDLIHVDVKKLGKVPDGGGWRYVGREQGKRNRSATVARTGAARSKWRGALVGTCYLHTVIDDHSRVAYVEAHDDETAATATAVLRNARGLVRRPRRHRPAGAVRQRIGLPQSHLWRETCAELGITAKRTRPYRPQTNGKIERFHRTLAEGWAFKKFYNSESARLAALPAWIHHYNHHRPHTAIGKASPITRLDNLAGHTPDMEWLPVKGQGEAPVRIGPGGRLVLRRRGRVVSVSLATRGQTDMRGLVTAGRAVRQELVRVSRIERRRP